MPYATNSIDGGRTYYEDAGGDGPLLVFMYGFMDPLPAAKALPIARRLAKHARLIFVDHRGHGQSDKPHTPDAYALPLRVADVVSVLDTLELESVHFAGISWGARLGFALGEHAPERFLSLTLNGNQPYAWDPTWDVVQAISGAMEDARLGGPEALVTFFESYIGGKLPRRAQRWLLENDPAALEAAWTSALAEDDIGGDFSQWRLPCLIAAGDGDEFHDNARRAASEIPNATFISLTGRDHMSAINEVDRILPDILRLLKT